MLACAIFAWGLMTLMGMTCVGLGGHMCGGDDHLLRWGGSSDTRRTGSGGRVT